MVVPRDEGWAWIVALGVFWNLFWVYGIVRSMGIIFINIQDLYDSSATETSLLFSISNVAGILAMPLHAYMYGKISDRLISALGGILMALNVASIYFTRNLFMTVIVCGVLSGSGSSFVVLSGMMVLNVYFKENLGLITSCCFMGSSLGQLIMPHVINYLLTVLDVRGTMLVLGASMLHVLIGSLLYRPESYYEGITRNTLTRALDSSASISSLRRMSSTILKPLQKRRFIIAEDGQMGSYIYFDKKIRAKSTPAKLHAVNIAYVPDQESQDTALPQSTQSSNVTNGNNPSSEGGISTNSNVPVAMHTISIDISTDDAGKDEQPPSLKEDIHQLLSTPSFLLFVTGKSCIFLVYYVSISFFAPYFASEGLDTNEVALVLTVFGASDLVSRPVHGWMVSMSFIDSNVYLACLALASSVISAVCLMFQSHIGLYVIGCSAGMLISPAISLLNVNTLECVGEKLFPRAIMVTLSSCKIMLIILPQVFGRLYDVFGSYLISMYLWASLGFLGSALSILEVKIRRPFV